MPAVVQSTKTIISWMINWRFSAARFLASSSLFFSLCYSPVSVIQHSCFLLIFRVCLSDCNSWILGWLCVFNVFWLCALKIAMEIKVFIQNSWFFSDTNTSDNTWLWINTLNLMYTFTCINDYKTCIQGNLPTVFEIILLIHVCINIKGSIVCKRNI